MHEAICIKRNNWSYTHERRYKRKFQQLVAVDNACFVFPANTKRHWISSAHSVNIMMLQRNVVIALM